MRVTLANLRASSAPWLAIPILLYAGLYITDASHTVPSKYGVESGELAGYGMAVIAPAIAGAAAWEAGRHRLAEAMRAASTRSFLRKLIQATTPALVLLLILVAGSLVLARNEVGVWPGGAGWLAVAHLIVLPLAWLAIGWSFGLIMPRSIAAPIVSIGCWAWLSMPHATSNATVRHLGGFIDGASTVTDLRSPAAYLVPWLVAAGFAVAALLLTRVRKRPVTSVVGSVLVASITFTSGLALVNDWGFHSPTRARTVALVCVGDAPKVCVPPEYEPYAATLHRDALTPIGRLKAAGLEPPEELRIASAKQPLPKGTWPLYWSLPSPGAEGDVRSQYAVDLAESAVTGVAAAHGVRDCRQPGSLTAAWAALVIGVDELSMKQAMLEADWAAIQKIRKLPPAEQADWFTHSVTAQDHCGTVIP
ncbi:hypothetical protein ABT218_28880 [Streptomyces sp. NPDC001455]|uniref:DUF7224 domain-containing protein n=1 Tax=unclassified Streptomyces TaxID=2593676 RepID=UPI0033190DB4